MAGPSRGGTRELERGNEERNEITGKSRCPVTGTGIRQQSKAESLYSN